MPTLGSRRRPGPWLAKRQAGIARQPAPLRKRKSFMLRYSSGWVVLVVLDLPCGVQNCWAWLRGLLAKSLVTTAQGHGPRPVGSPSSALTQPGEHVVNGRLLVGLGCK